MSAVLADTHAIEWYVDDRSQLPPASLAALEEAERTGSPIYVSAMSLIELLYLVEKRRVDPGVHSLIHDLAVSTQTVLTVQDVTLEVASAVARVPYAVVPDLPDRIIAATALILDVPLVTRDRQVRAWTGIRTIWS